MLSEEITLVHLRAAIPIAILKKITTLANLKTLINVRIITDNLIHPVRNTAITEN